MRPVDQINPGPNGDCLAACVASILEIDLEDVPDFCKVDGDWWKDMQEWMAQKGLAFLSVVLHPHTPWFPIPQSPWAIFIGLSKNGATHACVGRCVGTEFHIIHDPHPSKWGIDRVDNVCFFVPVDPATLKIKRILSSSIVPARRR